MNDPPGGFRLPVPGGAPTVDVRASVLDELRARRAPRAGRAELAAWIALAAGAAVLAALAYDRLADPFGPVMASVSGEAV